MKILNVNPVIETSIGGGTAERMLQMSYFMAQEGHDVHILTTDMDLKKETISYLGKCKLHVLKMVYPRFYISKIPILKLTKLVREMDVIHLMNYWTLLNIVIYFLARFYNVKYVICPAGSLNIFGRSKIFKTIFNQLIGFKMLRRADACIAVTEDEINDFVSRGVDKDKVIVIPNGIVLKTEPEKVLKENFKNQFELSQHQFVLFIGRLNLIKGPDILLDAFYVVAKEIPHVKLLIAGPDEGLYDSLSAKITAYQLTNQVKLIGPIQGKTKECAYSTCDLLVIPSRSEAMSIIVLEAGIYAKPVVFTNKCGLHKLTEINAGIEVSVDVGNFAKAILDHFKNSKAAKERGQNLRNFILNEYDWNLIIKKYIILYQGICEK